MFSPFFILLPADWRSVKTKFFQDYVYTNFVCVIPNAPAIIAAHAADDDDDDDGKSRI